MYWFKYIYMRYCPPLDICHFWCSLVLYNAGYVDMWEYVRTLLYLFPRAVFFYFRDVQVSIADFLSHLWTF